MVKKVSENVVVAVVVPPAAGDVDKAEKKHHQS